MKRVKDNQLSVNHQLSVEKRKEISFSALRMSKGLTFNKLAPENISEDDTLLAQAGTWMIGIKKLIIMVDYIPARFATYKNRPCIVFYQTNPISKKRERHRISGDLGRLPPEKRAAAAAEIIDSINARLPYGYPHDQEYYTRRVSMTTVKAFELVETLTADLRPATIISYRSSMRKFIRFLESINLHEEPVGAITRQVALAYSDHITMKGLSGRSHNNDINEMHRVYGLLKQREIITANPFDNIPKRKEAVKKRGSIPRDEAILILDHLQKVDVSVCLACALLYYCMIRPNEQRHIRRSDIDMHQAIIIVHGDFAKNHKTEIVTIPDELDRLMVSLGINALDPDQYIIGGSGALGYHRPVGKSATSNRYRAIIQDMFAKRILKSINGNTLYSWKDTGTTSLSRSGITGIGLKDQLRHHSLSETQAYIDKPYAANQFIRTNHRL